LHAYNARKRLISVRTSLFLAPLVALAALRNPVAGLQLALGGVVGVLNMLAVMHANERLLSGGRKRALHVVNGQVRIFAVGILPVAVAFRLGQFWTVGLFLAGFFTPLVLYVIEYRRSITREDQ
jgi:p-aminobenzoyl-glutamate transporter AbgT